MSAATPHAVRLADEMAALAATPLAAGVRDRACALLLDHLGVALGGVPEESTVALRRGVALLAGRGEATVFGVADRLPATEAALANGAAAHALEMDDTFRAGSIHLGAAVFPAALAAAELAPATGDRVLRAAVAGYEVAARLAMALDPAQHYARGFHPTGTCGTFGAAVAAGLVLGCDAGQLAHALGVAGSQAAGSLEFLADGSWTKRLHPGWAACAGLHAAALARAGFRAPATILEGRFGTLQGYTATADPARLAPGPELALLGTSIKPHACCRYMQGPIDATLALRAEHAPPPADVAAIEVGMLAASFALVCEPAAAKRRPRTVVDGQFSLPFGVAVALVTGAAGPGQFVPARFADPTIQALMDRVEMVRDPALDADYPRDWPCWVRIRLRDGRVLHRDLRHPLGDPENFPAPGELRAKFRTLAGRVLAPAAVDRLAAAVDALPAAADVRAVLDATRPSLS